VGLDELRKKLGEIEETRKVAERELKRLRNLAAQITALEQDKEALLESYASMVPEDLDALSSEERHRVYKMLRLEVIAQLDGTYKASGVLLGGILREYVSNSETSYGCGGTLSGPRRS
jgi:DNA repair exonuclease SbcCD ATPase subunit